MRCKMFYWIGKIKASALYSWALEQAQLSTPHPKAWNILSVLVDSATCFCFTFPSFFFGWHTTQQQANNFFMLLIQQLGIVCFETGNVSRGACMYVRFSTKTRFLPLKVLIWSSGKNKIDRASIECQRQNQLLFPIEHAVEIDRR